jgi:sugar/nucleoside kinase (ribokinase family)
VTATNPPIYDVIAIGNAIVDVLSPAEDTVIAELGLTRGGMALVDAEKAREIYAAMGPATERSGGSAANTLAGMAALGARCAFVGQVAQDQFGDIFRHDIQSGGIAFETPARAGDVPTGQCLILVSPDGERTMNTMLGAGQFLHQDAIDDALIASAGILYLEGYMWDPIEPRAAMRRAMAAARAAGRKIAFTASESFIISLHRADFLELIDAGQFDILFVNEHELATLTGEADFETGLAAVASKVPVLVATRSEKGAVAVAHGERAEVAAEPVAKVVDTTGAGDQFAAGFLTGYVKGEPLAQCLRRGAICASEVISHYGPRPETDMVALMNERL